MFDLDEYENELKGKCPTEVAGCIISAFPSIGFLNSRKRIVAFQFMSYLLELYRREGGDFVSAANIIIASYKPAKKAYAQAIILKGRFGAGDLDQAGFILIGGYGN